MKIRGLSVADSILVHVVISPRNAPPVRFGPAYLDHHEARSATGGSCR